MVNCEHCNVDMIECKFITQIVPGCEPYISLKNKFDQEQKSKVLCYVCAICGKIELRAVDLNFLK